MGGEAACAGLAEQHLPVCRHPDATKVEQNCAEDHVEEDAEHVEP